MAGSESQKGSIVSDLNALLKSGEGADVTFVVGHSLVPAHSFILAARSTVFAAMFRNDMVEARSRHIQITDMREATLRQLVSFVYTDTAPQLQSVAADLLAAADKYDLPLLKKSCEQQMERDLGVENAAAAATLAVLHRCPGLRAAAVQFIAEHSEVMATEGWERMLQNNAAAAVQISKLVAAAPRLVHMEVLPYCARPISPPPTRFMSQEMRQKMAFNLLEAARKGAVGEVWALLNAGAPMGAYDTDWNRALHLAAANGHATTVKCLIDLGSDVNAENKRDETPLHLAAHNGDWNIIWMLVAASAQVNAQDEDGQTPLHVAAKRDKELPHWLSSRIRVKDHEEQRRFNVVRTLLLAGAKKEIKDSNGKTPENVAKTFTKSAFSISFSP